MRDRKQQRVSHCGVDLEGLGPRALNGLGKASLPFPHRARRGPEQSRTAEQAATSQPAALQGILMGISGLATLVAQSPRVCWWRTGSLGPGAHWWDRETRVLLPTLAWPTWGLAHTSVCLHVDWGRTLAARSWCPIPDPGPHSAAGTPVGRGGGASLASSPTSALLRSRPDAEDVASVPCYRKHTQHPHQCACLSSLGLTVRWRRGRAWFWSPCP